jgi:hypothetical protein
MVAGGFPTIDQLHRHPDRQLFDLLPDRAIVIHLVGCSLFAMVFTILCHPLFWQLIWENITLILGLLLSSSLLMTVA